MRINPKNFIDDYITNPLAKDISVGERILSLAFSIILAPLTLGILHIRSAILKRRHISNLNQERQNNFKQVEENAAKSSLFKLMAKTKQVIGKHFNNEVKSPNVPDKVNQSEPLQPVISSIESYRILNEIEESEQVGEIVNTLITNYYSQPLPPKEEVTVPVRDDSGKIVERKWVDLTKKEKLQVNNTGTHAHNQISPATPEHIIDQWFFPGNQKPFLPGDPRESHGNDHCARAAIFSTVFAYLYAKYHPQYKVNTEEITLCQIVAGGHDCARQTEGPDVYDEKSAENTLEILKSLGVKDEKILKDCREAIADKDNKDLQTKSLIAKCVQNADCAEFARLLLKDRAQDSSSFDHSRNYLDIYNEFKKISEAGQKELKYGFSFEDFCFELDSLRKEMNEFIYITHKKQFREQVAASQNYYQEMLNQITPIQFPLLHSALEQVSIKKSPLTEDQIKLKTKVDAITEWKKYGFNNIPKEKLSKMLTVLENAKNVDYKDTRIARLIFDLKNEIESQKLLENTYIEAKKLYSQHPNDENLNLVLTSYARINYRFRNQYLKEISNLIDTRKLDLNKEMSFDLQEVKHAYQVIKVDMQHVTLKNHLISWNQPTKDLVIQYQEYCNKLQQMYHTIPEENRDPTVQTTVTLMIEKIATFYIESEDFESARKVLVDISNHSSIDKSNPFFDMKKCLASANGAEGNYLPSDSSFLRKRKMRVAQKLLGEQDLMELSFEVPSNIRKQLQKKMRLWPSEEVDATYYRRKGKMGEDGFAFDQNKSLEIGKDIKFTFDGVEILVGNTEEYWNQHNLVRVRFSKDMATQDVHKALCKIGLPMALMPSRPEDLRQELLARSLNFRFPVLAAESKKQSIETVYNSLDAEQKSIIDKDLEGAKMTLVGNDHIELVQPAIAKEAWERGVRSVGCFIWGGSNFVDTANVFKNILKRGLLSSLERFMCGILGLGCVPKLNYKAGSGNQVFTRLLTKNLFEKNYALSNFPVSGHVFIMLDPKVLERMPYSYPFDRAGVRNPNYKESIFRAQKQKDIRHFKGEERIKDRKGFAELIESLNEKAAPLNETMFDLNIGSKYIQKIVVWSESQRLELIQELQKSGVYYVNQIPLERAIVASTKLNPHMIDDFHQNTINKGDDDECEYI